MDEAEEREPAPAALAVTVHVSDEDPSLGLDVTAALNGDAQAAERVVRNLGGRLTVVVSHVRPGADLAMAGRAVRLALRDGRGATAGGTPGGVPGPPSSPADWLRRPALAAAAAALWHLADGLRATPTSFEGAAGALGLAGQAVLRLLDVDLGTWSQVAELCGRHPDDILDVHRQARQGLGLDDPGRSFCPSWPAVRTAHLAPAAMRTQILWHVTECQSCQTATAEAAMIRTRLLRLLPDGAGATPLLSGVGTVVRGFLRTPALDDVAGTGPDSGSDGDGGESQRADRG